MVKNRPAMPEDAEELSYRETCMLNQYQEQSTVNNTRSLDPDYCDSENAQSGKSDRGL